MALWPAFRIDKFLPDTLLMAGARKVFRNNLLEERSKNCDACSFLISRCVRALMTPSLRQGLPARTGLTL